MQLNISLTSLIIPVFLFAFSCKNKTVNSSGQENMPLYMSEEFIEFYDRFGTDSAFQMEHIVFPLEGKTALKDEFDISPEEFRWESQNWVVHRTFDDMDGTFTREMIDFKGIIIERISDQSGQYTMERRFSKLADGWLLIYYAEMGRH